MRRVLGLLLTIGVMSCNPAGEPMVEQQLGELAITELRRIDAEQADLSHVGSLLVAPNGDLMVTQMEDNLIRVFHPSGESTTIGRDGEGPGEFRRLTRAGWIGDSIWTLDPDLSRITIFGPDYQLVRSFPMPLAIKTEAGDSVPVEMYVQAVLPGSALRAIAFVPRGVAVPTWASDVDSGATHYVRVAEDGRHLGRILLSPPDRCRVSYAIGSGGHGQARYPFCASPVATDWSATAGMALAVAGEAGATTTPVHVTVLAPNGDTLMRRTLEFDNLDVTQAAVDSQAARLAAIMAGRPPHIRDAMPNLAAASTWPPVRDIVLGTDGTVWLELEELAPDHRWQVLSAKGELLGLVNTPANFSLRVATQSTIWGLETDADDLQSVVAYQVGGTPEL